MAVHIVTGPRTLFESVVTQHAMGIDDSIMSIPQIFDNCGHALLQNCLPRILMNAAVFSNLPTRSADLHNG